jgi:hypothetical protein
LNEYFLDGGSSAKDVYPSVIPYTW